MTTVITLPAIAEDSGARLITQAQLLGGTNVSGPLLTATGLTIATGAGTLADNNDGTWSYTPAHDDDTSTAFSYLVSDGVAAPVVGSATLDITPVNDAPVNTMPAAPNVVVDTDVAISGLAVSDVDSTSLTTTLHVDHGVLNVGAVGGATVAGSGSSTVTLTGSAAQIDAALGAFNNVLYHSAFDFNVDHLTMTTNDALLSDTDVLELPISTAPSDGSDEIDYASWGPFGDFVDLGYFVIPQPDFNFKFLKYTFDFASILRGLAIFDHGDSAPFGSSGSTQLFSNSAQKPIGQVSLGSSHNSDDFAGFLPHPQIPAVPDFHL
jgi:hypothetical protein